MPRFDDFQVKYWVNEAMALATRTVTALERQVEQSGDVPLFPAEYAAPDETGLKTEDEVLQDHLSSIGKILDPRSFAIEMGGEDGSVKMRATLSDEGRKQMGLKPKAEPTPSCDAPSCHCAEGEECKANGAAEKDPVLEACWNVAIKRVKASLLAEAKAEEKVVVGMDFASKDGPICDDPNTKPGPRQFVLTVDGNEVILQESGPDWHLREAIAHRHLLADTAAAIAVQGKRLDENKAILDANNARLEGLCKVVEDALAERRDGKADRKRTAPRVVWIVNLQKILTVSGQGTVWVIDTKSRKGDFEVGDCVTDHEGGQIMEVVGIASQDSNHTIGLTVRPLRV